MEAMHCLDHLPVIDRDIILPAIEAAERLTADPNGAVVGLRNQWFAIGSHDTGRVCFRVTPRGILVSYANVCAGIGRSVSPLPSDLIERVACILEQI
jgi:hypothetical protein